MAETFHFRNDLTRPADPPATASWSAICDFLAWEWESRLRLWDRMMTDGSYPPGNVLSFASPEERATRLGQLIENARRQRDGFLARAAAHCPTTLVPSAPVQGLSPPPGRDPAGAVPSGAGIVSPTEAPDV